MSLGLSETGLSPPPPPPSNLYNCSFQCDTYVVVLIVLYFGVEFLCCLTHISLGNGVAAYWEIAAHMAYDMFSYYKYLIHLSI